MQETGFHPPDGPISAVAITDLLSRIPIPPFARPETPVQPAPAPDTSWMEGAWDGYAVGAAEQTANEPSASRPIPAWAVLAVGSLGLTSLGLLAVLVALLQPVEAPLPFPTAEASAMPLPAEANAGAPADEAPAEPLDEAPVAAAPVENPPSAFPADPTPIPADVLTRLEAASNEPLHGELTALLGAIQIGFGDDSAQLEPTLRAYAQRMASRFEWNPDTFHVAVTAPTLALAEARAAMLRRLFGEAVAANRLDIRAATGPNALSLVSR